MPEPKTIQILNSSHISQYEALQTASISAAKGFVAKPETTKWYSANEVYPTLGAFHGDQLVSVMRLEWIFTWPELNSKMHSQYCDTRIQFPVAYLTKGGTHPQSMNLGLNSLLRYHALRICLTWPVEFLFGTMISGSSRVDSMRQMGYEFYINPIKWQGHYQSTETALIGVLNLKHKGSSALHYLETKYPMLINAYKTSFNPNDIKIKGPSDSIFSTPLRKGF